MIALRHSATAATAMRGSEHRVLAVFREDDVPGLDVPVDHPRFVESVGGQRGPSHNAH
jgi:hypothetical protein